MKTDQELSIISSGFQEMDKLDIVNAPWLAMNNDVERLSQAQKEQVHELAHTLSAIYKTGKMLWLKNIDIPDFYREHVYYETLLSTAAYLSYMRLGTLVITDEMIAAAHSLIRAFVQRDAGSVLLSVYARVMTYLNGQLLSYYGSIPEEIFVSGEWHRPWIERQLDDELELGVKHGHFMRITADKETFIQLSQQGKDLYEACKTDLMACGYISQSERLLRASGFTNMDDYERIIEGLDPKLH